MRTNKPIIPLFALCLFSTCNCEWYRPTDARCASQIEAKRIFHYIPALLEHWEENKDKLSREFGLLMHWAKELYNSTKQDLDARIAKGQITYSLLWAFFKPDAELFALSSRSGVPLSGRYETSYEIEYKGKRMLQVTYRYINFDEDNHFGESEGDFRIEYFSHDKKIKDLEIYPLEYHADPESMRDRLIERGRKFAALAASSTKFQHKHYAGISYQLNEELKYELRHIETRIIIDAHSFTRYPPGKQLPPDVNSWTNGTVEWNELEPDEHLICSPFAPAYLLDSNAFG